MKIIIGSTSEHKLGAVREACERIGLEAEISGVKTLSGVNEQPVGLEETYKGAFTRAFNARRAGANTTENYVWIGIENGIIHLAPSAWAVSVDLAVIVVQSSFMDKQVVTTSTGIHFPYVYCKAAIKQGLKTTTVGSIIAERTGCDPTDPHSYLTHGKVSRKDMLVQALMAALSQLP